MKGKYLILSIKHSEGRQPTFWRPDDAGYTIFPWAAGIYTEERVMSQLDYYADGYNAIPVELTNEGLEKIGFHCQMDLNKLSDHIKNWKKKKEVGNEL